LRKQADMITYQNASRCPAAFHSIFGYSVADFDALYAEFFIAHGQRLAQSTLTRRRATPRKRRPGAGRRFKHTLQDRLLLALFWLRVYPTLELLGLCFSLDKTSAEDNLKDMLATLSTLACFNLEHPDRRCRKQHTLEQILDAFPDVALVVDAGQQPIQQPGNPEKPASQDSPEGSGVSREPEPEFQKPVSSGRKRGRRRTCGLIAPRILLYRAVPAFDNRLAFKRRHRGDAAVAI
jgi:hypothetical protein